MSPKPYILVCDDNKPIAQSILVLLEAAGYRGVAVHGALDCVAIARQSPPDLILMDIMMPGMDGATAADLMREVPGIQHVPIVFLSAMPDEEVRKRALEVEAADYLLKPFTKNGLLDVVRRTIGTPESRMEATAAEGLVR